MNGVQFATAIRRMGAIQPIILTSGSIQVADGNEHSVIDYVLAKPVTLDALRRAVHEVMKVIPLRGTEDPLEPPLRVMRVDGDVSQPDDSPVGPEARTAVLT